jgi:hypothetical protein
VADNPVARLAELLENVELPGPSPVPLPSRLSGVHVAKVRNLTRRLGEACRAYGSDPEVSSAAAAWASRLLDVPGPDAVSKALMVAVAELHVEAGWDGCDAGLYDRTMHHYARALELATEAGDAYCQAFALIYAGLATVEHGQPNEGLKMLQYGGVKSRDVPLDDQRAVVIGVSGRAAAMAGPGRSPRPPWPISTAGTPPTPRWRRHGSCGSPQAPTPTATSTVPPPAWRSSEGASMRQSRSPWPRDCPHSSTGGCSRWSASRTAAASA